MACSARGHVEVLKLLLETEANREAKDRAGMNPLIWAAFGGHVEVCRLLSDAGISLNVDVVVRVDGAKS
jgi:ankyrin repeat protein